MSGYWPWWEGAISLGLITVGYTLWTGRTLGVSGAWERVVHWRSERRVEQADSALADESTLMAALIAATQEEFGHHAVDPELLNRSPVSTTASASASASERGERAIEGAVKPGAKPPVRRPLPVLCPAVLLISIYVGGLMAATGSGHYRLSLDMGVGFSTIVTSNPVAMVVLLFVGGVLVGFGTRLAGGCSSGHGLSGCSRLQPASILATIMFFGTAVIVSTLLWKVI